MLWCVQGDAAAKVGAEVDGGSGAPKTGRREEEEAEGHFVPIYKARDKDQARKSRGRKFGNRAVASIIADLLNKKVSWIVSL